MLIDCSECVMQETAACADCVVMSLLGTDEQPIRRVEVDDQAAAALWVLEGQGMAAPNRFTPRRNGLRAVS